MFISMFRTIIIYFFVILAVRFMGKRQIGELEPSELVVTILISNIASLPMQETSIPLTGGIIPIFTLVTLELVMSWLIIHKQGFKKLVYGKSMLIIDNGNIVQSEMRRARYSVEDLMQHLRQLSIFDLADVQYAIIETNGKLSVLKKPPKLEVTAEMLNITPPDDGLTTVAISNGVISEKAVQQCGVDLNWVNNLLAQKNIKLEDVFIMTLNKSRKYNIIKKDNIK